ncbi:hypothetical protein B0I35DRAFT_432678 [Stachybotrys elegans]|uniref:Zn(2)-C6 fungal-type domain-containing protein n=1 Tax=Stachybotrys elegans TaxID=80388 RepID=A0A8K0WSM5_9HYPO|nr:hypothetical protein B0I35DRAFT_432678 [Stachybotrys elegans]
MSSATISDENMGSLTPVNTLPSINMSPPRASAEAASGSNKRKRGKFRENERKKVSRVRARGACARCRVYHLSCDLNFPCSNCVRVAESATAFTQPCYHDPLDNVISFRMGNSRANQPQSQLPLLRWAADEQTTRRIYVEFPFLGIPSSCRPRMPVDCRKFVPRDSDILEDVWEGSDGDKLTLTFPPFACEEPEDLRASLESYIEKCSGLLEHDLGMETADVISAATFAEAQRYAQINHDSAVANALRIRIIAYFSRESMAIVGHESLGIPVVDDQRFPIYGQVPVPSVLDFQIDTTAIHIMTKLMEGATKRLKRVVFGRKNKQGWYEVYLTCFVLLESLEKVYSLQAYYSGINEHMGGNTFANISYTSRTMMDRWRYSADNLLYHYRCILRAMDPFSFAWDALGSVDDVAKANLDPEAVLYMQKMCKHLKEEREFFKVSREEVVNGFTDDTSL